MAAACGAEQDVPKKLGNGSLSIFTPPKYTVVFTPFGATISGFLRSTPSTTKPPLEENEAIVGTLRPYRGVLVYKAAPTEIEPSALA